ncbi:HD-GYP domain-containing protein [Cohnella sp. GCM10027633]|uniref:HD-GYP domain-containing protein n=1 Tax=unclassified Cohnella TaxID=2636738 RepID=UPI00363B7829
MEPNLNANQRAWTGRRLRSDLHAGNGVVLLPAGHPLSDEDIMKVHRHRIELTEADFEPLSKQDQALQALEESVETIQRLFDDIRQGGTIPFMDIRKEVLPAIVQSTEQLRVFPLLVSMQAKDDYTYRHNIAVGAISSMIGKWLKLPENEQAILTMGAILHDVGKMRIPEHILNKRDKLTDEEFEIMKKHTVYGYQLIQECKELDWRSALIALQHHEREDGSGYPFGVTGDMIDSLSKIVAIADVFHALTSDRSYRNASPFYEILHQMYTGNLGNFDTSILLLFTRRLMDGLIGCEVELTDGRIGRVVLIPPMDPTRPLIHTGESFIDLSKETGIYMEQIVG